ncbi:Organic cation transporter protein [Holothuria leucospilota]|uniref:Organic cation transporter protein n=1 Tax=Holothuria leucospilota TaxID=206669 RepID=A0A9Q0YQB1_HOLLE|nr:Organic cation transporter protein [Holothuria leucospilota]
MNKIKKVSELVGPSRRGSVGLILDIFFGAGIMVVAAAAYLIRKWRLLQLAITLPAFLTLLLLPVTPESPRWLYSSQRNKEAARIVQKIARFNRVKISDKFLEELTTNVDLQIEERNLSPMDLFRVPTMRYRSLCLLFIWFTVSLMYYGLILSTESLGVNIYLGMLISGAVDIFGFCSSIFLIEWFGRRLTESGLLAISALAGILIIVTPSGATRTVVGMIGKCSISAAFAVIVIYTAEMYPTLLRGMALGTCSLTSWVGGMLCPVIFILANTWAPLPLVLFAAASFLSSALTCLLPETKGISLPETIAEAEQLSRKRQRIPSTDKDDVI